MIITQFIFAEQEISKKKFKFVLGYYSILKKTTKINKYVHLYIIYRITTKVAIFFVLKLCKQRPLQKTNDCPSKHFLKKK